MMLLHGQADSLVPHGQSVLLYDAIKARCRNAQFFSVPGAGHGTGDVLSTSRYGTQTVRTTTSCQETTSVGSPNPSWDTIASFLNSALNVGGGTTMTTTRPTTTTSGTTTSTSSTTTTTRASTTTTTGPPGTCRVTYVANTWNTGFTADVTIANTSSSTVNGWSLTWTWPGNQQVTNAWNATVTTSGTQATARNLSYNGTIAAGASTTFGFQATYSGTNTAPIQFTLNGTACTRA